eukprot:scaffold71167_cov58-Phaeocystis_antarctica.AAC.6
MSNQSSSEPHPSVVAAHRVGAVCWGAGESGGCPGPNDHSPHCHWRGERAWRKLVLARPTEKKRGARAGGYAKGKGRACAPGASVDRHVAAISRATSRSQSARARGKVVGVSVRNSAWVTQRG